MRAVKESVILEGQAGAGAILAEAELLSTLRHSLLPQIADFFPSDPDGYSYLVMEYIEGITLQQYMAEQPYAMPGGRMVSYARQLLEVLEYLHSHQPPIIYRDLKPSNIMLTGEHELKVIDFGIARRLRSGSVADTEKLGTAGFAAPEQYGGGQSSPQSDLYGLGALLLYMASGGQFSAWQPGLENKLRGQLPDRLIPVIRRLLRQHPEERYASAEEVREALRLLEPHRAAGVAAPYQARRRPGGQPVHSKSLPAPTVIAVLGVSPGLGVTHTSLAAASCLSRAGLTAWVDCNPDSEVFNRMKGMADAAEPGAGWEHRTFRLPGMRWTSGSFHPLMGFRCGRIRTMPSSSWIWEQAASKGRCLYSRAAMYRCSLPQARTGGWKKRCTGCAAGSLFPGRSGGLACRWPESRPPDCWHRHWE